MSFLGYKNSSKTCGDEKGTTFIECAIVLPFLAFMVVATYDLGGALNQYLSLTRVVYEGARYAATLPGLELGEYTVVASNAQNQNHVRDRVVDLLRRSGFDPATFTVVRTKNDNNQWVSITLERPYQSMFGFFNNMPIRVSASGPYLSLNSSSAT